MSQSITIDLKPILCVCGSYQGDGCHLYYKTEKCPENHELLICKKEKVPMTQGSCKKCIRTRSRDFLCKICKLNNIKNSRLNSCPKCKYRHDGTCCVDCGDCKVSTVYESKALNVYGKCPRGHDGTSCVVCKCPNMFGICNSGHNGIYCIHCKEPNQWGECVRGHDGTYCVYCKELNRHGECPYYHTGETCSICDELKIFQYKWGSVCKTRHSETHCKKCNTPNIHKIDSLFYECPKCYFQEEIVDPQNLIPVPELNFEDILDSKNNFSLDQVLINLRHLTFTRGDHNNIYQLIAFSKPLPFNLKKAMFNESDYKKS